MVTVGQSPAMIIRKYVGRGVALPALFVGAGVLFGALILGYLYYSWQRQLNEENTRIKQLQAQKTDLEQVKQQVTNGVIQKKLQAYAEGVKKSVKVEKSL